MNFVEELKWRGMIHDIMPGSEEQFEKEMTSAYIGFDPTADSLHIGSLVQIMTLVHLQRAEHKPFALVGGATGMVGDPSGRSEERNLLSKEVLEFNLKGIRKQLEKFLDFDVISSKVELLKDYIPSKERLNTIGYINKNKNSTNEVTINKVFSKLEDICTKYGVPKELKSEIIARNNAVMVDNYEWFKEYNFLDFIRDVGKHITVNYMMAKDSVKKRLDAGMSFTEFTYQLVQGYDFYYLYKNHNCKVQLGGSDQWGNIVTGTELIRRKDGGQAFAVTTPLIKKADGTKFGKTAEGNVWLDPERTSPYKFYQYWINASDEDAENFIKIFTLLTKKEVDAIINEHKEAPHLRILQKRLAEEVTILVHSKEDLDTAIAASNILFGKATTEELKSLDEKTFLSVFEGVPMFDIEKSKIETGVNVLNLLAEDSQVFPSKGELRRTIKGGGVSINKEKIQSEEITIGSDRLLNDKYILVQKGKKNYFLIRVI